MAEISGAEIRAWARANGHVVADRGRIPADVVAAYAAAHRKAPRARKAPAAVPTPEPAVDAPEPEEPAAESYGRPELELEPASTDPTYDQPEVEAPSSPPYVPPAERAAGGGAWAPPPPAWGAPPPPSAPQWAAPATGPGGGPPAYGAPPEQARGTSGFAIAALVLGIIPILAGLLGIVFGIVALLRIRKTSQRGRGLAIAGIVLGTLWLVALTALIIAAAMSEPERTADGRVTGRGTVILDDLRVGDCPASAPDEGARTTKVVPCTEAHRAEVYATFPLSAPSFPGEAEVTRFATGGCNERLATFVGQGRVDSFDIFYVAPNDRSWPLGDREVICLLTPTGGGMLPPGSAKAP